MQDTALTNDSWLIIEISNRVLKNAKQSLQLDSEKLYDLILVLVSTYNLSSEIMKTIL